MPLITPYWIRRFSGSAGSVGNTMSLLHFDGTDLSTTITDSADAGNIWTVSAPGALSTTQKKFGASSFSSQGSNDGDLSGTTTDDTWWNGQFTVDFWLYISGEFIFSLGGSGDQAFALTIHPDADPDSTFMALSVQDTVGSSEVSIFADGLNYTTVHDELLADTWIHIAAERSVNTWSIYLNGTLIESTTQTPTLDETIISTFLDMGASTDYIDEFRISKVARYGGTGFTPSITAYTVD